jgi:hypothetical protein
MDMLLPAGFELEQLLPAELNWSVTSDAASGRKKLTVQLLDGRESEFDLTLLGRFGPREKWEEVPAPVLSLLGVQRQEGEMVVLSDPDTDVQVTDLSNAEAGQLQRVSRWLKREQQPLARAVLNYRVADYSATFKLTRKAPRVTVRTLSNVKVTRRAIEETFMLEYQIAEAGIHEIQFLLPESGSRRHSMPRSRGTNWPGSATTHSATSKRSVKSSKRNNRPPRWPSSCRPAPRPCRCNRRRSRGSPVLT